MAPKAKAPKAAAKATQQTAKPTGLQLSAAQWQAYNAAYTATATSMYRTYAIQAAAASIRKARLGAAYKLGKKVAVTHALARTAAIAQFAVSQSYRQSRLAHQNAALQQRVFADYQRHIQATARLQFAYKGEATYLHNALMRTLTSAQATQLATFQFAAAARTARAASGSTGQAAAAAKSSPQVAAVTSAAKAAGLAAARATPAGRTAPRPARLGPLCNPRHRKLFGDPEGYDCVAAAIANHLMSRRAYVLNEEQYGHLVTILGGEPSIRHALNRVKEDGIPGAPLLADYAPVPVHARDHCVIGLATENGLHAAYAAGPRYLTSWGELLKLGEVMLPGTEVQEAWALLWK